MPLWIRIILWVYGILVTLGIFFAIIVANGYVLDGNKFKDLGVIGDTIGGTTAPFIGVGVALLTFSAFWVQYEFNKQQNERIDNQDKKDKIDKFETRFYDLLRIHKDNVSEISIKNVSHGKRAFVSMFKEFRFFYLLWQDLTAMYNQVNKEYNEVNKEIGQRLYIYNEENILNIAFITFMFGTGESSNKIVKDILSNYDNPDEIESYLRHIDRKKREWKSDLKDKYNRSDTDISVTIKSTNYSLNNTVNNSITTRYLIGEGHLTRLGNYFRHLFYLVKFVDEQDSEFLDDVKKYNYIKILRAQLSAHEQLLIYYNSFTVLGSPWRDGKVNYIIKYKLLKNIPTPLADFGPKPETLSKGEVYFEWQEIANRLVKLKSKSN